MTSRRALGDAAEERACDYLRELGYDILERNYWVRGAEIDIVARDKETVVFVEVKYRSGSRYGTGLESVTARKLERMMRAVGRWMEEHGTDDVRLDAVEIDKDGSVKHLIGIQ
jgi:putative endonuclease